MSVIFGIDAGLVAPGFAIVETTDANQIGRVRLCECFMPAWKTGDDGKVAQLRKTEHDTWRIQQIVNRIFDISNSFNPDTIVAELPTGGSKSGAAIRGMAYSTAMTVSAIEAVLYFGRQLGTGVDRVKFITPLDNKKGATGKAKWDIDPAQGKWEVFNAVKAIWPGVQWPMKKSKRRAHECDDGKCWAMADALACVATHLRDSGVLPSYR